MTKMAKKLSIIVSTDDPKKIEQLNILETKHNVKSFTKMFRDIDTYTDDKTMNFEFSISIMRQKFFKGIVCAEESTSTGEIDHIYKKGLSVDEEFEKSWEEHDKNYYDCFEEGSLDIPINKRNRGVPRHVWYWSIHLNEQEKKLFAGDGDE